MPRPEFPSEPNPARDRMISMLELIFHVQRLLDASRLPRPDGEAVVQLMGDLARLSDPAAPGD
ncbi:hypothetical protein MKK88_21540 [Methylobacterium sp. E-005]|uniref:hypothetical protein n=1 Tax=Methylobacterium sp. E-005 TaxID=2836549 RepID=UPI001FBB2B9C|nr:hypothetical protein [Methylobacterium sp. E-005]MCJ2088541.1 hypothetical protein [Methylobacterium sp. E-005]